MTKEHLDSFLIRSFESVAEGLEKGGSPASAARELRRLLSSLEDRTPEPSPALPEGFTRYVDAALTADPANYRRESEPGAPRFKPGDRVCIPETNTTGTVLSVGDIRAQVQYDHGPIREPLLSILCPAPNREGKA
jgi:hypothetical protein